MTNSKFQRAPAVNTQLILLTQAGDDQAFHNLVLGAQDEIQAWIRRFSSAAVMRRSDVHDLCQEVTIRLLRSAHSMRAQNSVSFRSFVRTTVRNMMLNEHDRHTAAVRHLGAECELTELPEEDLQDLRDDSPSQVFEEAQRRSVLIQSMQLLDDSARQIVQRHAYDGATFVTIAAELGIEPDAARMRFCRAKVALARIASRLQRVVDHRRDRTDRQCRDSG